MLHHIPGLTFLNESGSIGNPVMWGILAAAFAVYVLATALSCRVAMKRFDRVDM